MSETDHVTKSLRALLTHTQEQQQNEKIDGKVRRALQAFAEDIQCLLGRPIHDSVLSQEWTRLFCQRAERIRLKYNYTNESEWQRRREAIGFLLATNGEQAIHSKDPVWARFLTLMNFERALEERAAQATKKAVHRADYSKRLVRSYLRKCISLHSKIKAHSLNITARDIFKRLSLCADQSNLTAEQALFLDQKLGSVDISLGCSRQQFLVMSHENRRENIVTSRNFIPSINVEKHSGTGTSSLESILRADRWIMLLGVPGSGKTSLLRWLTVQYAYSAVEDFTSVYLNDIEIEPVRVPVLIRIGEFAEWLNRNPVATLFDYIGYQTWLGERYMSEEHDAALKCAVLQGRALILLDGLDEVTTFDQQARIRHLITEFISKHVRSNNQVSAYDDTALVCIEDEYVGEIGKANQIIISSRLMEYRLHPWESGAIKHYFLSPLTKDESTHFVNNWTSQVEDKITYIAATNGITFETSQCRRKKLSFDVLTTLQKLFAEDDENSTEHTSTERSLKKQYRSEHVLSLPMILSLLCSAILNEGTLPSQKVRLYHDCIHSTIPTWISSCGMSMLLSESILVQILSHLAYYLHRKSESGLIDEFDLKHFCNVSLHMIYSKHARVLSNRLVLESQVEACMQTLSSNVGMAVVSNLGAYGFIHLTFQEYFAALALTMPLRDNGGCYNVPTSLSINKAATQLVEHTIVRRFREPLFLALSLVSWQLCSVDFDSLCYELVISKKSSMPFGALLLLEAVNDLVTLPSKVMLLRAFHSLVILDYSTVFDSTLRHTLTNLLLANNWLADYFSCEKNVEPFCKLVMRLTEIPKVADDMAQDTVWGDEAKLSLPKWMTPAFSQQLHDLLYVFPNAEYILDQTLRRINMLQDGSICMCKSSLQHYLLQRKISIWQLHSTVVALIIAIYGGLFRYRGIDELFLKFNPQCMHRDSVLSSILIEYLDQDVGSGHIKKLQQLITACEQHLKITSPSDMTIDTIDLMVALICLRGLEKPSEFLVYSSYTALPVAVQRFKRILFYLRQTFVCVRGEAALFSTWIQSVKTNFCDLPKRSESDVAELLESTAISFVRLTETASPVILREKSWWKVKPACVRLPIKLGDVKLSNFLSRAPCVLRLLCSNQCYSSWTSLFKEMLRTAFNTAPQSALLAFVPRSMHPLYERLIFNDLLKIHDTDENGDSVMNENDQKVSFAFFLYQVLRYTETKINFRLCPLVLSLLEPFLTKHGLTNYIVAFLAQLRNDMSFDFKDHPQYVELSTPNRVQVAINEERCRIEHMVALKTQKSHDEHLFASAICLMRLCRNYQANEVFHDVCRAVFAIRAINLRALTITAIWRITHRSQVKNNLRKILLRNMSLCFELQPADASPLITSLLLVHSFSMKKAFPKLFELQYNAVVQRLNDVSLSIEDIRAISAALSDNLGNVFAPTNTVIDYQQRTSVAIGRCLDDDMLWSSNRHSGKTVLFASLYLAELAVDVQVLRYCFTPQNVEVHTFPPESMPSETLTYFDALTLVEAYQKRSSDLASISDTQLQKTSTQLCHGEYTLTESQQLILQLRNHLRLFVFIQQDCLSLVQTGVFTPLTIGTLCASLESSDEKLRQQSHELFKRPLLFPFELDILHILMNSALSYIEKSLLYYACILYNRMKISRLEDLQVLLQVEYNRFHTQSSTLYNGRQLSFLLFIGQCERDVLNHFIEYIRSLISDIDVSMYAESTHLEYVNNLIRYGVYFLVRRRSNTLESVTLFSEDATYRQFLIDLLKTCRVPAVQEVAAQVLAEAIRPVSVLPNHEFQKQIMTVHQVFWEIVVTAATDEDQREYTSNVLSISLCSLGYRYVQQSAPLFSPDKPTETILINLHKNHGSRLVQDRAQSLLALYYLTNYGDEGFLRHFDMDAKVAYRLLMYSLQDECGHFFHRPVVERKISSLIGEYSEQLLSLFVHDFQCYITSNENFTFQQKYPAHIRIATRLINSRLLKKYCEVVRMSTLGELGFLQALRSASKKWTTCCLKEVLLIAAAFGNLTWYIVDFILEVALRLKGVGTEQAFVALINEVAERETIDYIVANLRASSMIQRYIMGEMLVHLALKDIVSPLEVANELLDTINDSTSQLILHHEDLGSNVTLSEEMSRLFKRLICIVPSITPIKEFSHFISQQAIDHDFSNALGAFNNAFCLLSNETDSNS